MPTPTLQSPRLWHAVTLVGYFGLLVLLLLWESWLAPAGVLPKSIVILLMVGPLLFPLRGLLHGRPYTHAWTSFLALFYFLHGVGEAYAGGDHAYLGGWEVLFSVMLFIGAILYTRFRSRELKAASQQQ